MPPFVGEGEVTIKIKGNNQRKGVMSVKHNEHYFIS